MFANALTRRCHSSCRQDLGIGVHWASCARQLLASPLLFLDGGTGRKPLLPAKPLGFLRRLRIGLPASLSVEPCPLFCRSPHAPIQPYCLVRRRYVASEAAPQAPGSIPDDPQLAPLIFSALKLASFSKEELRTAFNAVDVDRSGRLDVLELKMVILNAGFDERRSEGSAALMVRRFDTSGDGRLSFDEFVSALSELAEQQRVSNILASAEGGQACAVDQAVVMDLFATLGLCTFSKPELRKAFEAADRDSSGRLDVREIARMLNHNRLNVDQVDANVIAAPLAKEATLLMKQMDADKNGLLTFEEFYEGMRKLAQRRDPRVWPVAFVEFLSGIAVGIATPAFPLLARECGLGQAEYGYTVSSMALATLLANVPCAVGLDRYGRKPVLSLGIALQAVSMASIGLSSTFHQTLVARFVNGVGVAGMMSGVTMTVSDLSTPLNRSAMLAAANGAFNAGKVVGPALGGTLIEYVGLSATAIAGAASFSLAIVVSRLFVAETLPQRKNSTQMESASVYKIVTHMLVQWREIAKQSQFQALLLVNSATTAAQSGSSMTVLPLMLAGGHLSLSPFQIGNLFALQSAVSVCGVLLAASFADRFGPQRIFAPAAALSAFAIGAFPWATDLSQASILMVLWAFGRTVQTLLPTPIAVGLVPLEARAQALALLRTTGDLGFLFGASTVGLVAATFGADVAMYGSAAFSLAVASIYAVLARSQTR